MRRALGDIKSCNQRQRQSSREQAPKNSIGHISRLLPQSCKELFRSLKPPPEDRQGLVARQENYSSLSTGLNH